MVTAHVAASSVRLHNKNDGPSTIDDLTRTASGSEPQPWSGPSTPTWTSSSPRGRPRSAPPAAVSGALLALGPQDFLRQDFLRQLSTRMHSGIDLYCLRDLGHLNA